jgi:hypothetical protein
MCCLQDKCIYVCMQYVERGIGLHVFHNNYLAHPQLGIQIKINIFLINLKKIERLFIDKIRDHKQKIWQLMGWHWQSRRRRKTHKDTTTSLEKTRGNA